MEIKLYRCRICGEVFFGKKPTHCPHCGVHAKYLVRIGDWLDENKGVVLSDISRKNLNITKDLEFHASRLYRASARDTESDEIKGFFKYLARTEKEHYEVACKLLGEEISDDINGLGDDSTGNDFENIMLSKKLEENATKLYIKFSKEANEPRVTEYFKALSEVEADHICLDEEEIRSLNQGIKKY